MQKTARACRLSYSSRIVSREVHMPPLFVSTACPIKKSQAATVVALNTKSVRDSPSASPFPGKRGDECGLGGGNTTSERTHSRRWLWRAEQAHVHWMHWACSMGCSHRACIDRAAGHASAPVGLPWALGSEEAPSVFLAQRRRSCFQWHICSFLGTTCCCTNKQRHTCVLAGELHAAVPLSTLEHTAVCPVGRESLFNLTRLAWCPSAPYLWVGTTPSPCETIQDPVQQQIQYMDMLLAALHGRFYLLIWLARAVSDVDFLLKHMH